MSGRILIVDDTATQRILLKVRLAAAGYQTIEARTGADALRILAREAPDLIVMNVLLPDIDGAALLRHIRARHDLWALPVVAITGCGAAAARLTALEAGANEVLARPFDDAEILARMRSLLRRSAADLEDRLRRESVADLGFAEAAPGFLVQTRITLVAQHRDAAARWKAALARHLPHMQMQVRSRDEALTDAADTACPDAFVIAAGLEADSDGLMLMADLRARARGRHAVICVVPPPARPDLAAAALDLGADDLLTAGPQTNPHIAAEDALRLSRQIERKRLRDRQRADVDTGLRLAATDPLTGLHNRRYGMAHLARLAAAADDKSPLSVMVLDLDRFKTINDSYGHLAGDAVLIAVSREMAMALQPGDLLARIGGEEFLVALPKTPAQAALGIARRLCARIGAHPIPVPGVPAGIRVTVSIGVAEGAICADAPAGSIHELADRALRLSKKSGRNQARLLDPAPATRTAAAHLHPAAAYLPADAEAPQPPSPTPAGRRASGLAVLPSGLGIASTPKLYWRR